MARLRKQTWPFTIYILTFNRSAIAVSKSLSGLITSYIKRMRHAKIRIFSSVTCLSMKLLLTSFTKQLESSAAIVGALGFLTLLQGVSLCALLIHFCRFCPFYAQDYAWYRLHSTQTCAPVADSWRAYIFLCFPERNAP